MNPATPPEALIHDIGRVLLHWDPEGFYDRVIGPEDRKRLFDEVDLHGMNLSVDGGEVWLEAVSELARRHPEWSDHIMLWHDRWLEMASPAISESVELMRTVRRKGIPVYALTNFGRETFAYAQTQYDFLHEFDGAIVSGEIGLLKPDPAIYAHTERVTGKEGSQLLFVDDNEDNIRAASARGWRTHLFTTPEAWAERLIGEGLL